MEHTPLQLSNAHGRLTETLAGFEAAACEAVSEMLHSLRLPTLKQALSDLGLPVTGGKAELTQRLSGRLTAGLTSQRGSQRGSQRS